MKKTAMPEPSAKGHRCYGELEQDWIGIECLTGEDCPEGLRCCATGDLTHCSTECEEHEACVPGRAETCHVGSRCQASGSRSGGDCVVASPGVTCGATRCSGAEPACRFDRRRRWGECIALTADGGRPAESVTQDFVLMQCAGPADCAGERCCAGGPLGMTECAGACMIGIDVCETVRDCPHFIGPPIGCEADPEGPPFLKKCRYAVQR